MHSRFVILSDFSLLVENVVEDDDGLYTCTIHSDPPVLNNFTVQVEGNIFVPSSIYLSFTSHPWKSFFLNHKTCYRRPNQQPIQSINPIKLETPGVLVYLKFSIIIRKFVEFNISDNMDRCRALIQFLHFSSSPFPIFDIAISIGMEIYFLFVILILLCNIVLFLRFLDICTYA